MNRTSPAEIKKHLYRNFVILLVGILAAVILVRLGAIEAMVLASAKFAILANFVAGFFFTSVLTVGTATAILAQLMPEVGLWQLAAVGALGAVIGDFLLFSFVKDKIADDFVALVQQNSSKGFRHILKLAFWHRLLPVLGFLVVASPLPDEIGLAMMGLAKINTRNFIFLSFVANFVGIIIVGLIAR